MGLGAHADVGKNLDSCRQSKIFLKEPSSWNGILLSLDKGDMKTLEGNTGP